MNPPVANRDDARVADAAVPALPAAPTYANSIARILGTPSDSAPPPAPRHASEVTVPQPAMTDRTNVEMRFAGDTEARRQAVWVPLLKYDFDVPKGAGPDDPRATARTEVELPFPLMVLGIAPHMHLRGRSARVEALGAAPSCLLDVPKWNFHHQEAYWLNEGVRVDRVALTCQWDNRDLAQPTL